jgi:hypothetical protein
VDESERDTDAQSSGERETLGSRTESPGETLDSAALVWKRRSYQVQYRDEYLVQLTRRAWPVMAGVLVTVAAVGAVAFAWRMYRSWYVVSVAVGPDGQVVTHRRLFSRPPSI